MQRMLIDRFPVGLEMDVSYPEFRVRLNLLSGARLSFEIEDGPFARTETVDIQTEALGNGIFAVSWREQDGATVVNVQDHDRGLVHSFATLPDGRFLRMAGTFTVVRPAEHASDDRPRRNKALVLEAMTALFQRHDASAVERLYAPGYIQHNPGIAQGRDALQALVATLAPAVHYEPGLVVAVHGRIRGWAATPQVVVDMFRIEDGRLAEHWDVLQDEIPATAALAGLSMFDPAEASRSVPA